MSVKRQRPGQRSVRFSCAFYPELLDDMVWYAVMSVAREVKKQAKTESGSESESESESDEGDGKTLLLELGPTHKAYSSLHRSRLQSPPLVGILKKNRKHA